MRAATKAARRAKKHKWLPYALGAAVVGGLVYVFWPKTASAATNPALPAKPSATPPAIVPGPGNIQISAGSRVPLTATLRALVSQEGKTNLTLTSPEYVSVPAGTTIAIDELDPDGTIYFQYAGRLLSSPVEDYTASV